MRGDFPSIGSLPWPLGPAAFKQLIAAEQARWGNFINEAGLKPTGTVANRSIGTPRQAIAGSLAPYCTLARLAGVPPTPRSDVLCLSRQMGAEPCWNNSSEGISSLRNPARR